MGNYISSNANRFYTAVESTYGQASTVTAANRFPAVELQAHQTLQYLKRLDKTGTRTYLGTSKDARRQTAFLLRTYLTSWNGSGQPAYGPLFQAALGGVPVSNSGLLVSGVQNGTQIATTSAHGLSAGASVAFGNEIRFVTNVMDALTFDLNAPFSTTPNANSALAPSISYPLGTTLPSLSLYDYWDPVTAVSRLITGVAVNEFQVSVNGDYHGFAFSGPAADLLDSNSFANSQAGLSNFPSEPALAAFDYSIVPGHLGEVWLGGANQFFTLTGATIAVKNNLDVRNREYGSSYPLAIVPGQRQVVSEFTLFAQDDAQTKALYGAAKQRNPVPAMLQLGQQQGQLFGIFMPQIVPEIPNFDDSETRLQWQFKNNLAQGFANDEIYIAFA
ncbi:MAG: hypothetical protein JOY54_18995 [Acidobacteriaceae bacterium]|nr:hypothetical protein [Acidobacteriaceae bacterium]